MKKEVDLHLHTTLSDGLLQPEELVRRAKEKGFAAIAITDHDEIGAIRPAQIEASRLALEIIPAIELTSELQGKEIHILGYLIDIENRALRRNLSRIARARRRRIKKMVAKLKKLGQEIDAKEVFDLSGEGVVGRLHLARAMLKKNIVPTLNEAFARFIGDKGPAHVGGFGLKLKKAIKLIKQSGGVPVIAHPDSLEEEDIRELVAFGVRGIEVFHPRHRSKDRENLQELARKHNLLITGGSDCHGLNKPCLGTIRCPYEMVEELRRERA